MRRACQWLLLAMLGIGLVDGPRGWPVLPPAGPRCVERTKPPPPPKPDDPKKPKEAAETDAEHFVAVPSSVARSA